MGGVAVHAIGAARRDDLDGWLVHARIAHLHGAGVGAQQQGQALAVLHVHVEGILHGPGGMVFRVVQGREIGPVVLDFGAIGHIEADGTENGFDPLPSLDDGMDAPEAAAAAGQADVYGFGGQALVQFGLRHVGAPLVQQRFDLLLDLVDARPFGLLALGVQLRQPFQQRGQRALLAEKARLGVFQRGGVAGLRELFLGLDDQVVSLRSHSSAFQMQTEPDRAPFCSKTDRMRSGSQSGFGLSDHGRETGLVIHGHIGQHLAV